MAEEKPPGSSKKSGAEQADEPTQGARTPGPTLPPAPVGRSPGKKTTAFSDLILGGAKKTPERPSGGAQGEKKTTASPVTPTKTPLKTGSSLQLGAGLGLKLGGTRDAEPKTPSSGPPRLDTSVADLSLSEMEVMEVDEDEDEESSTPPARATSGPPQRRPPPRSQRTSETGPSAEDSSTDSSDEGVRDTDTTKQDADERSVDDANAHDRASTADADDDEMRLARAAGLLPETSSDDTDGADNATVGSATYPTVHWAGEVTTRGNGDAAVRLLSVSKGHKVDDDKLARVRETTANVTELLDAQACAVVDTDTGDSGLHIASQGHGLPSLREVMIRAPLPLPRACGLLRQVATVIRALEKEGIEHGALTADAILIGEGDRVQLTDTGLTQLVDLEDPAFDNEFAPHLPETAVGMPAEHQDVYGFGCIAFFALTGRPLFREGNSSEPGQQRRRHAIEEPDRLKRDGQPLHKDLDAFVRRCLEKEPSDRFEDFGALGAALSAALEAAGITTDYDDLSLTAPARTLDSRDASKTTGAIVAKKSGSEENLAPPEQTSMRIAGASITAPIAEAAAATASTDRPAAGPPNGDEKGLDEFELGKAHFDWTTKSRRPRQIAMVVAAIVVVVLCLKTLSNYMSERAAERDAEERAALARGDLPDRWKDPNESLSTTGTLEVEFPDPSPAPVEDPSTTTGSAESEDTAGGDTDEAEAGSGDDTTGSADPEDSTGEDSAAAVEKVPPSEPAPEAAPEAAPAPAPTPSPAPARAPTGDPDKIAKDAASALRSGSRSKAISLYKQALSINSRHVTSLVGLSDIYFDSGSYSTAARYLRRLTSVRPSNGKYRLLLGDAYYKSGAYAKAVTQYEKAVSLGVSGADRRLTKAKSKL